MTPKTNVGKLFASSNVSYLSFLISGIRNLWLAKLLLPQDLASNSLSSLIITLCLFMDFGAVMSIKRIVPKLGNDHSLVSRELAQVKKLMLTPVAFCSILSALVGITLLHLGSDTYALGFLAGAAILPLQSVSNFRSASYVALGKSNRSANLMLLTVASNFMATLALEPILNKWVIVVTPIMGYAISLLVDYQVTGGIVLFQSGWFSKPSEVRLQAKKNVFLFTSQILAFLMVTIESWLSYPFLGMKEVASLGLLMNLIAAISIYPVMFSNQIQSKIVPEEIKNINSSIYSLMRRSRLFLAITLSLVCTLGCLGMTAIILNLLPQYSVAIFPMWLFVISAYFYGNTFYSSNYPIVIGIERKISRNQIFSVGIAVSLSLVLFFCGVLDLATLGAISVIKALIFSHLTTRTLFIYSSKTLSKPTSTLIQNLGFATPLAVCACGFQTNSAIIVFVGVIFELVVCSLLLPREWKAFSKEFNS